MSSENVQRGTVIKKDRKRLYSWSRPSRDLKSRGKPSTLLNSEHCICGSATIAFHPSGEWFQGNVINKSGDSYAVHGRRRKDSTGSDKGSEVSIPGEGDGLDVEKVELCMDSSLSSTSPSASSNDEEVSNCGSLDSSLVQSAMERLNLDMEPDILYHVQITDYETGIEHKLKDVVYSLNGEVLRLENESLQFVSNSFAKGNMADVVIAANIGPSLAENGLTVYRGEFSMTYKDEPCFPVSLDASQWCL